MKSCMHLQQLLCYALPQPAAADTLLLGMQVRHQQMAMQQKQTTITAQESLQVVSMCNSLHSGSAEVAEGTSAQCFVKRQPAQQL